jgi:hypothetical protein
MPTKKLPKRSDQPTDLRLSKYMCCAQLWCEVTWKHTMRYRCSRCRGYMHKFCIGEVDKDENPVKCAGCSRSKWRGRESIGPRDICDGLAGCHRDNA